MIAQRRAGAIAGELRITYPDGTSKTFPLAALETMEALDPHAVRALREQVIAGELTELVTRPARIDHDVDSKPRDAKRVERVR